MNVKQRDREDKQDNLPGMPFVDCPGVGCVTSGPTIAANGIFEAIRLGTECRAGIVGKYFLSKEDY